MPLFQPHFRLFPEYCPAAGAGGILQLQARKAKLVQALLSDETTGLRIDAETLTHLLAPPAPN